MTLTDYPCEFSWTAWPKFDKPNPKFKQEQEMSQDFMKAIIEKYGEDTLRKSWTKACEKLLARPKIGTNDIPDFDYQRIVDNKLTDDDIATLKEVGCFVVRNVVDEEKVKALFQDLRNYQAENVDNITAWPKDNPCILNLYWTKLQIMLRSDPNHLKLQKWINCLWTDSSNPESYQEEGTDPLTYCDAIRVRPPGPRMVGLGPHIDAGSLTRWADPTYRACYDSVFKGQAVTSDFYDLKDRKDANQEMFIANAHSSVFRAFQGWTALTRIANQEGAMYLRPYVADVMSYIMLRPFFKPTKKPEDEDYLDPSTWEFVKEDIWLPGTFSNDSQLASAVSHAHLMMETTLVSVPTLAPGDTIWWHCDMIHAVDTEHNGRDYAGVVYIAAVPSIPVNKRYVGEQARCFAKGDIPHDFNLDNKRPESELKGFQSYALLKGNKAGQKALMLDTIEV